MAYITDLLLFAINLLKNKVMDPPEPAPVQSNYLVFYPVLLVPFDTFAYKLPSDPFAYKLPFIVKLISE